MASVPVLENSSDNSSIMFTKLLHGKQKLFCWFGVVLIHEKSLHMFVEAAGQTRLVYSRCLSITTTTCTGMWRMVNSL